MNSEKELEQKQEELSNESEIELQEHIKTMPEADKNKLLSHLVMERRYSGPLPPAEEFAMYDKTTPGAGNRILAMAEDQAHHRQSMEKSYLEIQSKSMQRGQRYGFALSVIIIVGGFVLIALDKNAYGIAAIITAVVGLVTAFAYGNKKSEQKEQ